MEQRERTLQRLLRKPVIADYIGRECQRLGADHVITDAEGAPLVGSTELKANGGTDIVVDGRLVGYVHGPCSATLARLLEILGSQESETRALARESLNRYKELTMLYSISEKFIGARDLASIAAVVCDEAGLLLRCDSIAVLLLNPETDRLELTSARGNPFHDRSIREIGKDIIASVLESGTGEIINDVEADTRGLGIAGVLKSVICSPMKSSERVFGVLVAGTETQRHFNAGDLQILNAMAAHAAAAIEVDRLNRDLKATSRKPVDLIYSVDEHPPLAVSLLMGLQHTLIAIMSLAYPVLMTLEAGGTRREAASVVSMSLIAMATATVLQAFRYGPVGSGFLAPYITSAIYLGPSLLAARLGGLGLVFTMTMLAGVVSLGMSQIMRRFRKLFPPEVSGVVVLMVGLSMVPVALSRFIGTGGADLVPESREWVVGLITLATILIATVLSAHVRIYATAIGLFTGYLSAVALGLFEFSTFEAVRDLPLIGLQPVQWTASSVEPLLIIPFLAAALASNVKDAGLVISCQKANDAAWKRPDTHSMSGGLIAGGIGNIASGALGGIGLGVSAGSVGLAVATGATARIIGLVTAGFFVVLAFLPKATAILALIPSPVMGAGLLYVACHLVASGVELIASRMLDARRIYVIGLPLLAGVGLMAMPDLLTSAPPWIETLLTSPLAASTILALGLNLVLNVGVSSRASQQFDLDNDSSEAVARFLERQGASWGARSDIISRAAPAVTEWWEELYETINSSSITVELFFDEFQLLATVKPATDPGSEGMRGQHARSEPQPEKIARMIARRYGCTVRLLPNYGVVLRFEH